MPSVEVEMTFSYVHRRQNHHHHMWLHLGDFSGGPNHQFHDMSHVYVDENTCKCQSRMYSKGLCVRNLADNSISTSPSSPAWSNCGWGDICAHPTRLDRTCKKCMLAKVMWNENLHRSIGVSMWNTRDELNLTMGTACSYLICAGHHILVRAVDADCVCYPHSNAQVETPSQKRKNTQKSSKNRDENARTLR